jgi:hypothetical protein
MKTGIHFEQVNLMARERNSNWTRPHSPQASIVDLTSEPGAAGRARRLNILLSHIDRNAASEHLNMSLAKLAALEEGRLPIGQELAFFIESEIGLPGGWLDNHADVDFATFVPTYLQELASQTLFKDTTIAPPPPAAPVLPVFEKPAAEPVAEPVKREPPVAAAARQPEVTPPVAEPARPAAVQDVAPQGPVEKQDTQGMSQLSLLRVANLKALTAERGFKSALSKLTGLQDSYVSRLFAIGSRGFRTLSDKHARKIEQAVALPDGWLDAPSPKPIPVATQELMRGNVSRGEPAKVKPVAPAPAKPAPARRAKAKSVKAPEAATARAQPAAKPEKPAKAQ